MNITPITCQKALNKIDSKWLPYNWDLNIYRGCEHGCKYCFAMYSHEYLGKKNYFGDIFYKENIVEKLEMQLCSHSWKREVVNLGGICDSYQPAEEKLKIMPEIWKLLIKYKTPAIISTKSDMILRDYDLIEKLAKIAFVGVAATITSYDDNILKVIEPNAVSYKRRFNMLNKIKNTGAVTSVHVMPIIPYFTDSSDNIECIMSEASKCGVKYTIESILNLRGKTRDYFYQFLSENYSEEGRKISKLYSSKENMKAYKAKIYSMVKEIKNKYNLSNNYRNFNGHNICKEPVQLTLF